MGLSTGKFGNDIMKSDFKLAPSILSADFSDLAAALRYCKTGGVPWIHVDVMDNQFVPNLTVGPPVVEALRPQTKKFLDVHLMAIRPESLVAPFARAGADGITFHLEATSDPTGIIDLIRNQGKQVGISLKPGTPVQELEPYLDLVDLVLMMSVEPGFGAQEYLPKSTERIRELNERLLQCNRQQQVLIEVDGGVKLNNAPMILETGADVLVVGSAIFAADDPVAVMQQFNSLR